MPYSSVVEQSSHKGDVVGSIPTRAIMDKEYNWYGEWSTAVNNCLHTFSCITDYEHLLAHSNGWRHVDRVCKDCYASQCGMVKEVTDLPFF